jgi:hypothetical protein
MIGKADILRVSVSEILYMNHSLTLGHNFTKV